MIDINKFMQAQNIWHQLEIKYIKDIYIFSVKKFHSFEKLKKLYNVPNADFLKYLSLVQSIPNYWKTLLKHENDLIQIKSKMINKLLSVKQTNTFAYKILLQSGNSRENKSE